MNIQNKLVNELENVIHAIQHGDYKPKLLWDAIDILKSGKLKEKSSSRQGLLFIIHAQLVHIEKLGYKADVNGIEYDLYLMLEEINNNIEIKKAS